MKIRYLAALLALSGLCLPSTTPEDYATREVRGWTVRVHPALADPDSQLGRDVLELLDHKLFEVRRTLPGAALEELEEVVIWMELDDERVPGGVYHPSREWLVANDYDPELARCVQFGNARNFLGWSFSQPSMVLHELAHAYHHQVLGHGNEAIAGAFAAAREGGGYAEVLRYSGRKERAYALSNAKEYFAELTEAYFGVNDFYPFVRAEVRELDPRGYAMLKEAWGE